MGAYREKNGKSRVGDFLRKVGKPEFFDKALTMVTQGMSGNFIGAIKTLLVKDSDITESQEAEFDKVAEQYYEDLADARDMYKSTDHIMSDNIADKVIKYNHWFVMSAVVIEILTVIYLDDKVLIAIISGAIGGITTALMQERQQIINFFFGSSRGSKEKDKK